MTRAIDILNASSKPRRLLAIVGAIALIAIVMLAAFFGYFAYQGNEFDVSSKSYVDTNVPLIVSSWSSDQLLKRASPQLLNVIEDKPQQVNSLFQGFSKLGYLRSYNGSKGDSNISFTIGDGKVVTAFYVAAATFEHGNAQISVRLIRISGSWQFLMFNVTSPVFTQ